MKQWVSGLLAAACLATATPAAARVTATFWSQDLGQSFPHAFVTLAGTPDAGGPPVDMAFGFTAKTVSPALLLGTVPGTIDYPKHGYIAQSNARFQVVLTDDQYRAIKALLDEWGEKGDHHYNLHKRNCVSFVAEAARRAGLTVTDEQRFVTKPYSFLTSVEEANVGKVVLIDLPAKEYWAGKQPGSMPPAGDTNDNAAAPATASASR